MSQQSIVVPRWKPTGTYFQHVATGKPLTREDVEYAQKIQNEAIRHGFDSVCEALEKLIRQQDQRFNDFKRQSDQRSNDSERQSDQRFNDLNRQMANLIETVGRVIATCGSIQRTQNDSEVRSLNQHAYRHLHSIKARLVEGRCPDDFPSTLGEFWDLQKPRNSTCTAVISENQLTYY